MKRLLHLIFCLPFLAISQPALNVDLFAEVNRGDTRYSGCWTYVAPDGAEYGLIGTRTGTAVYSIDDANDVTERGFVPGPESNWREITVIGDHAFVTTEGSSPDPGMQVIDLSSLPNSISLVTNYTLTFGRGHIIQRDIYTEDPYVYISGTQTTSGVHIIDVSDPANPVEVGLYQPGYYIHDCHVKGDRLYAAAFFESTMDVIDISDKTNPQLVIRIEDPGGATRSSWLTEDDQYLFVADEQDGLPGRVFDVSNELDPTPVAIYTANIESLVHNPYIRGDYAYITHNTEGFRVVDLVDPAVPVEVGFYDTFDGPSGGFSGLWSACPYLPSGKIIGADRTRGLMVWTFNNTQASRFYGTVVDSVTMEPIMDAEIVVTPLNQTYSSDFNGEFKGGGLEGTYTFTVSAIGYETKTISLPFEEGASLAILIQLASDGTVNTESASLDESWTIFPNPTSDRIWLESKGEINQVSAEIYDPSGIQVMKRSLNGAKSEINVQRLTSGVYQILLKDVEGRVVYKQSFIKQ